MGTILEAARQLAGKVEVDFADWHEACKDKVRSQVIMGDALLEDALDYLIQCRLSRRDAVASQMLKATAANNKTRLAYVLGLITKGTMQDLQCMHNIRNIFAHECEPDSSNPKLVREILRLSTVKGKRDQVSERDLMDFYFAAGRKCRDSIFKAINESRTTDETTEGTARSGGGTRRE